MKSHLENYNIGKIPLKTTSGQQNKRWFDYTSKSSEVQNKLWFRHKSALGHHTGIDDEWESNTAFKKGYDYFDNERNLKSENGTSSTDSYKIK